MQCSVRRESDRNCGNNTMKTINSYKNHFKKESNVDTIVGEVATRLQHVAGREGAPAGMPIEQAEAVRRYYAAFPALKKGDESPRQYYLPPPAWCRNTAVNNMQSDISAKDWNVKTKRFQSKERRHSYHGQKKNNRRRCNGYGRGSETERLPEWVTSEGVWDMESQDPVREFIRALALDEGYGTCENTVAEETKGEAVPQWEDGLEWEGGWRVEEECEGVRSPLDLELYAKFEAKFDRSLEALWASTEDTPDDDYHELPIDFAELLASPSDRVWETAVWAPGSPPLHDRLRPLHLASPPPPPPPPPPAPPELESFALYDGEELYCALATVADTLRSLTAINHSRDTSGFAEVPPRRCAAPVPPAPRAHTATPPRPAPAQPPDREDLLTSARTHFRPIRREGEDGARYADGDTFTIRASLEPVSFRRSDSGGAYLGAGAARVRYLEYRAEERERGIDYTQLALTASQHAAVAAGTGGGALPLRFPLRQLDAAAQTDAWPACDECAGAAKKMRSDAGIWGEARACVACAVPCAPAAAPHDELSRDWEELLADISAAHAHYAAAADGDTLPPDEAPGAPDPPADRKRRHSAALRCARQCAHPHARFLPCCALDRPLTR